MPTKPVDTEAPRSQTRLSFLHLKDTNNIGDRWCSPYYYFNWAMTDAIVQLGDLRLPGSDYDVAIFGGGKIMRDVASSPAWRGEGRLNIGWGISTVQRNPLSPSYWRAKCRLDVIGSRDWDGRGGVGGYNWVPCASSEHSFFDAPTEPVHDFVVYAHSSKGIGIAQHRRPETPWRDNTGTDLIEALRFLASGETVVSNSYHGVFWALLLGRRVLCVPFSNKFGAYRLSPGYAGETDWLRQMRAAKAQPDLLDLCREATNQFRKKVFDRISIYQLSR